jgi:hypothetical protein
MAEELNKIPPEMAAWNTLKIKKPIPTAQGRHWALVGCEPARIEQSHQVLLLDEDGNPAQNTVVVFGFGKGGGTDYTGALAASPNNWHECPAVINGNAVKVINGYAQHTYGGGGEDIWVWDLEPDGSLNNPSDIVYGNIWINTGGQPFGFNHQGTFLTFQLLPWKEARK